MPSIISKFVEICIFKFERDRPLYLLLHRAKDEKVYPNIWQCVSGGIDGKETGQEAALRELQEETGFVPEAFWILPYVNVFYDPAHDSINMSPVFAAQVASGSEPKLSGEHDEYLWCGLDEALKRLTWPGQRKALRILHRYIVRGEEAMKFTRIK